jgi:hypothetical protein
MPGSGRITLLVRAAIANGYLSYLPSSSIFLPIVRGAPSLSTQVSTHGEPGLGGHHQEYHDVALFE